ncbi:MAG: hypothetical protein ACXV5T_07885 [Halobacteriota archaeon]
MDLSSAIKRELAALPDNDKERFERIRAAQIAKHGSEMPEQLHGALHTIRRALYERQAAESIKEGNFARFRDARLNMAVLLEEEVEQDGELLRKTLATHLEVCYLDLNGPQNSAGHERELTGEGPFVPSSGVLEPNILDLANVYIKRLGVTRAETEALFHKHNSKHLSRFNLPLSLDQGWHMLECNLMFEQE